MAQPPTTNPIELKLAEEVKTQLEAVLDYNQCLYKDIFDAEDKKIHVFILASNNFSDSM